MVAKSRVTREEAERLAVEWMRRTGPRLRRWRTHVDMTQMEVAYNADVSVDSLRSYESARRKPLVTVLVKMSAVMGVQLADLLFRDPPSSVGADAADPPRRKRH